MREIGYWDYVCPDHGSIEQYTNEDWDVLLDDIVEGGFNSFVLCVKWLSTGYRSRLPWLDQRASEAAGIASDNATLYHALDGMARRGIKVWILVVATIFEVRTFGMDTAYPEDLWGNYGTYDPDLPGMEDRIAELCGEVAELFGSYADGIVIELEACDKDAPHRVPRYDAWAKDNGRPDYATIKNVRLDPRSYPFFDWRDYTTQRRIDIWKLCGHTIRSKGFVGRLAALTEVGCAPMVLVGNTNLGTIREQLPEWSLVTYDSIYDRRVNRLATMDFCVEQPRSHGFDVLWLTRGVMTFGANWSEMTDSLAEQWRMEIEDALRFNPDILWFMSSDARSDGMVVSNIKLPRWGYPDGRTARKALMAMAREMGLRPDGANAELRI